MNIEIILITISIIIGLYMAWNIGANDVANALGTSVGSKALTLKKAIIIAAILEFAGAFLLGSHVSSTIQKDIIYPDFFSFNPTIFALGMISSLFATAIWLNLASYFYLPVSTTHSIIGSIIGFGAIVGGLHAVNWRELSYIITSWILTPLSSGFIAYLLFSLLQKRILYALNPLQATKKLIPFLTFFSIFFFLFSFTFKGTYFDFSFISSFLISSILGLLFYFIATILIKRVPDISPPNKYRIKPQQTLYLEKAIKHLQRIKLSSFGDTYEKSSYLLKELRDLEKKIKKEIEFSKTTTQYIKVEKIFGYLQILSVCLITFAHGANDVANAIGPIAATTSILKNHQISNKVTVPYYLLLIGGAGIIIGLISWGWRIIETIGKKITELTPTRGFSAEFGAAMTILFASKLGLPISTTHALVGAILGVGIARGINAINLKTLRDIILSWFVTIPVSAILSIVIFYLLKAIFNI
ncbi:MAG: inorganic phosphate transporter [Chlamydiae bacterium SM23_39]|nr:MAG: inorganic phosphate transporter [Chlamydiae bacterium SM23_39]